MTPDIENAYEIAKALRHREETDDSGDLFMTSMILYVAEKTGQRMMLRNIKDQLDSTLRLQVDEIRASRHSNAEMRRTLLLICGLFGVGQEESSRILSKRRILISMNELLELADEKGLATD